MHKGKFIVMEGGDKSGKTTQIALLEKYLKSKGLEVILTREPGGKDSIIAEKIRAIILDKNHTKMNKRTELLLFLASRAQHVSEVVEPALAAGQVVLSDRFDSSTFAYQVAARNLELEKIKDMNNWAKYGLEADLIIYLDISASEAENRRRDEKHDRLDRETQAFHEAVRQGYLSQAKDNNRWFVVSAVGTIEEISQKINKKVDSIL
ncbi:MAG: dTMP kinase [Candidatus Komeilibacteria bacterium RIFOXYC1_FULL_37_11]|uniref:Thymidylate kinase n=1 Tax=Candidatus Komeilibacteria bacterium RIFOXYC1_FULL_37_11 TaxID=1798555 RepID=A0A1G2BWT6_9BACT|nr:MAG: dTMP kinase [Candidatus Komeilibacteria bacterium RIFOXYC1_FULL_37_11]OGY95794.1 MAG: dTMP kinase [Candidatus Komeilibacteria bacterium RIFOXYD1_FULL_37_29]OGY95907.1 MAG: dTMP kinase [Candidatus Komeilibacteria bacterium RIFOXYD2_FULL_37_8]